MVDLSKTFEVRQGLSITEGNVERHLIASGVDAPTGESAPQGSRYERSNGEVWYHFIGGWGIQTSPTESQAVTYIASGDVDVVSVYSSPTQITANRIADITLGYSGGNPTTETWRYFDPADGTTVLQTSTLTHGFTGVEYDDTTRVDT